MSNNPPIFIYAIVLYLMDHLPLFDYTIKDAVNLLKHQPLREDQVETICGGE